MIDKEKDYRVLHLLGSVGMGGAEMLFYDLSKLTSKKDNRFHYLFYGKGALAKKLIRFDRVYHKPATNIWMLL